MANSTPSPVRNASPLERLRLATANQHTAVEQAADWKRSLGSALHYSRLLSAYEQVIAPADEIINRLLNAEAIPYHFIPYARTQWLKQDKAVVSGDLEIRNDSPVANHSMFNMVASPQAAIGVLYVLEGSSLGGQFLSKQLFGSLGYTPQRGGQFFAGFGAETVRRWKDFCTWANSELAGDVDDAERAAIYTFERFIALFSGLKDE